VETSAKKEVVSRKTRGLPISCFHQMLHLTDVEDIDVARWHK